MTMAVVICGYSAVIVIMPAIYMLFRASGKRKPVQMVIANCRSSIHEMRMSFHVQAGARLTIIKMNMAVNQGRLASELMRMHSRRHKNHLSIGHFMLAVFFCAKTNVATPDFDKQDLMIYGNNL
jgi:hypothetical protein